MLNVRSRAVAVAALTALAAGSMVGVAETSASAAQDTRITSIASSKPIKGEKFKIRGTLRTELARPVKLQRLSKSGWVTIKTGKSTATGRFEFVAATTTTKTYRVRAPKAKIGSRTYIARTTQRRTVKPVSQTARVVLSVTKVRVGSEALKITAVFTPIRKGRAIELYVQKKGEEADSLDATQDSRGKFSYDVGAPPEGSQGTYYLWVKAKAANGAPSKTSKKVSFQVVD